MLTDMNHATGMNLTVIWNGLKRIPTWVKRVVGWFLIFIWMQLMFLTLPDPCKIYCNDVNRSFYGVVVKKKIPKSQIFLMDSVGRIINIGLYDSRDFYTIDVGDSLKKESKSKFCKIITVGGEVKVFRYMNDLPKCDSLCK